MKKSTRDMIEACRNSGVRLPNFWGIAVSGGWGRDTTAEMGDSAQLQQWARDHGHWEEFETPDAWVELYGDDEPFPECGFPCVQWTTNFSSGGWECASPKDAPSEFEWAVLVANDDAPAKWYRWFDSLAEFREEYPNWELELSETELYLLGERESTPISVPEAM